MSAALKDFEGVFPVLLEDLKKHCLEEDKIPNQVWQWFEKSLSYNVIGGKCNRGLSVIDTAAILFNRALTPEEYFHTATLGWLIELLQAMFLVLDDIMDSSLTRRKHPCWYILPNVGMIAVNDGPMLGSAIFILLKKHFRNHAAYVDMVEIFQDTAFRIEAGQTQDMMVATQNMETFDQKTYDEIVTYKTAYYSFYLPVALALFYTGRASPENLKQAEKILVPMGQYFQVQDDYLDNFADTEVLGKIGTDIPDGKCSWLVVQALRLCTPQQMGILTENYGKKEGEERIKELYRELDLEGVYLRYEESKVEELRRMIGEVDEAGGLRRNVFTEFLGKIYKRSK